MNSDLCFFVSDLHGKIQKYQILLSIIREEKPAAVFFGGDLLPPFGLSPYGDFVTDFLVGEFRSLRDKLRDDYPNVFLILGNDDSRISEKKFLSASKQDRVWTYVHNRCEKFGEYSVYGYSYVPPTPFLNKDWERYDVSRYVDPGCIPPEEGSHSQTIPQNILQHSTIQEDLEKLVGGQDLSKSMLLFHTPPYKTNLDRAALDGKTIDHVPLDVHVGSIAVKKMIVELQPHLTMHGHVHESARITGTWKDTLGKTQMFSAAHDGSELALIRFDPAKPWEATRELVQNMGLE